MNRCIILSAALLMALFVAFGCSSGGGSPVTPANDLTNSVQNVKTPSQTHLWGYYDVYIDIPTQTATAVLNRDVMFAANVTQFVNKPPTNLAFDINETIVESGYIDVDIDVLIKHPFTGLTQYNGYDVRGVFMGAGSATLAYNSDLDYPVLGTDQYMLPDPIDGFGGADGYTRWFNPSDFTTPGLFGYLSGVYASKGYKALATFCPYKYFADGLGSTDDLWDFLTTTGDDGVFSAGTTNTRNYYLRFPNPAPGIKYSYAIIANWVDEVTHPANAPESQAVKVTVTDDVYYVDDGDKGGDLILDIDVFGWEYQPSAIFVESTVLSAIDEFDSTEMTPIGGDANYSTYHCEIPADNINGNDGNEYWVICQYDEYGYTNDFGVTNLAGSDELAAGFRFDLFVADVPYNKPPEISSGVDGNDKPIEWTTETYTVTATDPDADPLNYSWTLTDSDSNPVEGYDGVPGDGAGSLDIDWGEVAGWTQGVTPFSLDCVVSDAKFDVPATTLDVEVWVAGNLWVSNNTAFDATPDNGTQAEPFSTINQALAVYTSGQTIVVDYGTGTYNEQIYQYYAVGNITIRGWSWYTTPVGRPKLTYSGSSPIYIYYTPYVTIRGFKVSPYAGSTANQLVYAYYSPNISFYDCYFTGQLDYYYYYVMYLYYCDNMTVKNCLFSDLNTNYPAYTYAYMYFYFYRGNGVHNVSQNEFTKLQETPQVPGYMYFYLYCYYWPANSKFNNNLFHHISPNVLTYGSIYIPRIYYPYANVTVANNTIDKYDMDKGTDVTNSSIYGMYLYNGGSATYGYDANSNIVSNMNGTKTQPYYYGIYAYNTSTNYDDVYNIQDTPYGSAPAGPNSISADPLYVNNTTEPYDYHLATGSPCIGTGKAGVDMGCYGNLPAGETVGLLTPK